MRESGRILFVTDTLGYGGAEKQMVFAAEGLLNRGWDVAILNLSQDKSAGENRTIDKRIMLFVADIPYHSVFQSNYGLLKYTATIVRKYKPNIIVGFNEIANFCVSVVGKICDTPSIISERGDPFISFKNAHLPRRIKLWCINRSTGAIFQTRQASEYYKKQLRENSIVIPNPVFVNRPLPCINYDNLPKTVVSLGRLDNKQKRLDIMLDAFSLFHDRHPEYKLKIYGNGPDEIQVKNWVCEKGLSDCVILLGVSIDSLGDLSREGIFLITSDYEGISNALLEAMACGLPVVSTDHTPGGARLLIRDKENGLLAPIRDVNAISNALSLFAEDSALRTKCGNNAKKVLLDYSPERILDLWEGYVSKLIEEKKKSF